MSLHIKQLGGWYDKQRILKILKEDYDNFYILFDLENYNFLIGSSFFYYAKEGNEIKGVMLIYYHSSGIRDIWLSGDNEALSAFLENFDRERSVFHLRFNNNENIFKDAEKIYHEYCMVNEKPDGVIYKDVKLISQDYYKDYGRLMSQWNGTRFPRMTEDEFKNILNYSTVYGYFVDGQLVSAATMGATWRDWFVISSVFTDPNHRNKGYAGKVVSTILGNYNHLGKAILYVNKNNDSAINAYKRNNFRIYSEELWVDYGTGLIP
ncbi:MAG: GNAT family N-acetyltransferase [Thermoplasmata archaeon]